MLGKKELNQNKQQQGKITIVVGGNYGSESKGCVVGHFARDNGVDICVRTGAINAGHTVYYEDQPYKMQLIPAAWVNPDVKLVIGAGAYVEPTVLENEIRMINRAMPGSDVRDRLFVDFRCGTHLQKHHDQEKEDGLHGRMGSTGEGCGAAIIDKLGRRDDYQLFGQTNVARLLGLRLVDTARMLNDAYDEGQHILIEGTQGTGLDLHFGHYPYVTSRQTIAASWLAECGLAPTLNIETVMVVRTFPIRVAGNSGPLADEIEWTDFAESFKTTNKYDDLAIGTFRENLNNKIKSYNLPDKKFSEYTVQERRKYAPILSSIHAEVLSEMNPDLRQKLKGIFEFTTVTKKLRRIGKLDITDLQKAVMLNRPTYIVLTFLNYVFPHLDDATRYPDWESIRDLDIDDYIKTLSEKVGTPINYTNINGKTLIKIPDTLYGGSDLSS
jgi:adenylosuccinate synthase